MATGFILHLGRCRHDAHASFGRQKLIRLGEFFGDQAIETILQFNVANGLSALSQGRHDGLDMGSTAFKRAVARSQHRPAATIPEKGITGLRDSVWTELSVEARPFGHPAARQRSSQCRLCCLKSSTHSLSRWKVRRLSTWIPDLRKVPRRFRVDGGDSSKARIANGHWHRWKSSAFIHPQCVSPSGARHSGIPVPLSNFFCSLRYGRRTQKVFCRIVIT